MATLRAGVDPSIRARPGTREAPARADAAPVPAGDRRLEGVLVVVVFGLVAMASLAPFRFDAGRLMNSSGLGWPAWKWTDAVVNLAAYVPVGAVVALWLRRGARALWVVGGATVVGAALSFFLESLQAGLATRWASWSDLILNMLGALCGALLIAEIAPIVERVTRRAARAWAARQPVISRAFVWAAWILQALIAGVDGAMALIGRLEGSGQLTIQPLPIWDYLYQPELAVVRHVVRLGGVFGALGITLALASDAGRWGRRALVVATFGVVLLGSVSVRGEANSSDFVVAAGAVAIGLAAGRRWLQRVQVEQTRRGLAAQSQRLPRKKDGVAVTTIAVAPYSAQ